MTRAKGTHSNQPARLALALTCLASLGFTTSLNRAAAAGLRARGLDGLDWIPESCLSSCIGALLVYLAIRPTRPFSGPVRQTPWHAVLRTSATWLAVWLAGSSLVAWSRGRWFAYTHGA